MDRALKLSLLAGALDGTPHLPSPEQLRSMLAKAEVAAFFRDGERLDNHLVETAWNLHHAGTARPQLKIYDPVQQVQANAVAAHIFDLALQHESLGSGEQLVLTFAAQVSSIRGDRMPNATALGRRLPPPSGRLASEPGQVALELGCAFLTLDRGRTAQLLRDLLTQARTVSTRVDMPLTATALGSAVGVIDGVRLLQRYLTTGDLESLTQARKVLMLAATEPYARFDLDSRWVAAHLVDLCDDFGESSVWAILPEGTPPAVGRAMTLGNPPVMALWPPQVRFLKDPATSPLQAAARRAVLTFPTSAGKTLMSQLLIAHHLAVVGSGVCFVAPSHSLCREIKDGLDRRLWVLRRSIAEDGPLGDQTLAHAPVVVMTPEKLAARLRTGEQGLLDEFGLFVLDEAHLVDDGTRGWTFETTVSRLHALTTSTDHRLFLISAALGGTASVQTWLDIPDGGLANTSSWRGPRRLHATYTQRQETADQVTTPPEGKQKLPRTSTPLKGIVHLYVDDGEAVAVRTTALGHVIVAGKTKKQPTRPEQLEPIVRLAARSGPVLTVHATKLNAERLASQLAKGREERGQALPLVRLAEQRLGPAHPLVAVLRCGVAYHHAALPADIQAEIEGGVRSGALAIICATTTLTEGINLPVRTVIICERGYFDGTRFIEMIDAAALMNAAGRAGRAGWETEGWVIVSGESGGTDPRRALRDLDKPHDIRSTLAVKTALAELAAYEALVHETAGLLLTNVPATVDGFLAYCWYLADVADTLDFEGRRDHVLEGIQKTLAWRQLPLPIQARWEALARRVATAFEAAEPNQRRRWARSGARLSANAVLEAVTLGAEAAAEGLTAAEHADPIAVLRAILADGRLQRLLSLVHERDYRFKRRRGGPTELVPVDVNALVLDWVAGTPLADLASRHLSGVDAVEDDGYRFEQLSTFLTRICEHHLPFTLGTVLDWLNRERIVELCPSLARHVHYGAAHPAAIELLARGVRSRRLAVVVGQQAARASITITGLRPWLVVLGVPGWRSDFAAGAAEVGDLLQFVHDPAAAISGSLLDGDTVTIALDAADAAWGPASELPVVQSTTDERPRPLVIVNAKGDIVGTIRAAEHRHLAVLVDAGFQLLASPATPAGAQVTQIRVRADVD